MPMDGLTLGFLARELKDALMGGRIDKIAQPERDELIITVRSQGRNHLLLITANAGTARAHLTQYKKNNPLEPPMLCQLMRKHLTGGRVMDIRQVEGDRILEIDIAHTSELGDRDMKRIICEFMGKHSNIMLVDASGRILECARRVTDDISRVREVLPGLTYQRPPAQDKLPYDRLAPDALAAALCGQGGTVYQALGGAISGLSRQSAQELALRALGEEDARLAGVDIAGLSRRVCGILEALRGQPSPMVVLQESGAPLDVTAFAYQKYAGLERNIYPTLSEAVDAFYRERDAVDRATQKSAALRRVIRNNIERCEKKLALQLEALEGSARMEEFRIKGELITASLHQIKKGQKMARLTNYYDEALGEIDVALDETCSPSENAQRYFKRYQKARSARDLAAAQKVKTEEELTYFEGQLLAVERADEESLSEIRAELERLHYVRANHNRRQMKSLPPSRPDHYRSTKGRDILVGRNNLQNDKLTGSAEPDETWLHAKDMPGSHVIIVGPEPDDETLTQAALLAARYSKGGASSRVPVDYTLRKYVKKPSGARPGFVIYTHQHTLYVTPDDAAIAGIERVNAHEK